MLTESLFIDYIFQTDAWMYDKEKEKFKGEIQEYLKLYTLEDFKEFVSCFFDERATEDIDFDYIAQVGIHFTKYMETIQQQVDTYAQTFTFHQMDPMDQAIFLLGYTEWKELETPKEVVLNEMIELAKRYSDEWAPKLLNGIMHKIVN